MNDEHTIHQEYDELFVVADIKEEEAEKLAVEPYSYWESVFREFRKKPSAMISLILMIIIVLLSIFVPIFSPYNPYQYNTRNMNQLPNATHWFGTDSAGMDIFTRVWYGARTSLMIAFIVSLINTFVGLIIGTIWGYFRELDLILQEVYNFVTNIPALLYYIILAYVFNSIGIPSIFSLIIAMTLIGWVGLARFVRNQILIFNNREYNIASRALGTPARRIIIYNLLPYILTVVITSVSLAIPQVIAAEVSLAYFGIGLGIEEISLGRIVTNAYRSWVSFPHTIIFPVIVVALITIVFYLLGLALSDALDPKTHR